MKTMSRTEELRNLSTEEMREIYNKHMISDFPKSELPPLNVLEERRERDIYDCLGLFENGELKAYAFFVLNRERKYLLLDFLAVCQEGRGGGYGSHFLQLMREYYKDQNGILLECESERASQDEKEWQMRHRRIHFYEKNGCIVTKTKCMLFGVEMDILYLPIQEKDCDSEEEINQIYRLIVSDEKRNQCISVWNRHQRMTKIFTRSEENGELIAKKSLMDALGFPKKEQFPQVVSLVGGGGKTSTMYQLADELAESGYRVLVTTSTHIQCPENREAALVDHVSQLSKEMWQGNILTAGKPLENREGICKLSMPEGLGDQDEMERILSFTDVILIEADGAKRMPVKIPADHEPVIVSQTGLVIACAGLSALGKTFEESCFRFEKQGKWLMREKTDRILPEDEALILMDQRGSHKDVNGRYYRVVLNQADTEETIKSAQEILNLLPVTMQSGCAVTGYRVSGKKL